jgi:hypothetical protein
MAHVSGIDPARVEEGRWIYSAWKHLRVFASVQTAAAFEATILAGKIGDLLGRLRQLSAYTLAALTPLAKDAGMTKRELTSTALPVLETLGIVQIERRGTQIANVRAFVLSQDDVMDQLARIFDHVDPEPIERGALVLLAQTATLPLTRAEAAMELSRSGLSDEEGAQAIELALAHQLVHMRHVADFAEDFLYNDFLWGENVERTTAALGALPADLRSGLRSLLEEVHAHEGRPAREIESASPELVQLAINQGLIDATQITTAEGKQATFHFTPRFRGFGVSRDEAPDVLDQVKLVIASFAFATRYARFKLSQPEVFLDSLIDRGYAGNATPIGTDYGAMEKQKIVNVEPVVPGSSRYRFLAVKRDTLVEARDTMRAGALLLPNPRGSSSSFLREPQAFTDPVATRERARQPGQRPLHDEELLAAIRDAAQQDRFR